VCECGERLRRAVVRVYSTASSAYRFTPVVYLPAGREGHRKIPEIRQLSLAITSLLSHKSEVKSNV
jgi:hypothetical protein